MKAFASFALLSVIIISCAPTEQTTSKVPASAWYASAPTASENDSTIYAIGMASASDSSFAVYQSTEFARAMIARYARTILNSQFKESTPGKEEVLEMNETISELKKNLNAKRVEVRSIDNIFTAYIEMELEKEKLK